MYKNNSRDSSKLKSCGSYQLHRKIERFDFRSRLLFLY